MSCQNSNIEKKARMRAGFAYKSIRKFASFEFQDMEESIFYADYTPDGREKQNILPDLTDRFPAPVPFRRILPLFPSAGSA